MAIKKSKRSVPASKVYAKSATPLRISVKASVSEAFISALCSIKERPLTTELLSSYMKTKFGIDLRQSITKVKTVTRSGQRYGYMSKEAVVKSATRSRKHTDNESPQSSRSTTRSARGRSATRRSATLTSAKSKKSDGL